MVCAGAGVESHPLASLMNILHLCRGHRISIAALGTATWLLAKSGILNGTSCTNHWEKLPALCETFDHLHVTDSLFVRDGNIVTCAGELGSFDLALELISTILARKVHRPFSSTQARANGALGPKSNLPLALDMLV